MLVLSTIWNGDGTAPVSSPPNLATSKPFWAVATRRSSGLVIADKPRSTTAPCRIPCRNPSAACPPRPPAHHGTPLIVAHRRSTPECLDTPQPGALTISKVVAVAHLLGAEALHLRYPTQVVFDGVTVGVNEGDRIGIVGRNGDGKSSLLGMLTGRIAPDSGRVTRRGGLQVAALDQADTLDPERLEELMHDNEEAD